MTTWRESVDVRRGEVRLSIVDGNGEEKIQSKRRLQRFTTQKSLAQAPAEETKTT